ncbi:hypothetical protein PVAND_002112 [Polypedilum vanderplanki]|uniref:Uncharacterized protein n=1 Tax=Polypedilum vanderplanki TaxID=319348 RepID=A0A9J6BQE7_POLVA|nr:hypothetical protein PVAND_002112 [Polypedilum vanderplanki]
MDATTIFKKLRLEMVKQHCYMKRHNQNDDDIIMLISAKFNFPYDFLKEKFRNMEKQFNSYRKEGRQFTDWMNYYYKNDNPCMIHLPFKIEEDVEMADENQKHSIKAISSMDTETTEQPEQKKKDFLLEAYFDFLKHEIIKRPIETRKSFIDINNNFLYEHPVSENNLMQKI